jgi:hypothetical protein
LYTAKPGSVFTGVGVGLGVGLVGVGVGDGRTDCPPPQLYDIGKPPAGILRMR